MGGLQGHGDTYTCSVYIHIHACLPVIARTISDFMHSSPDLNLIFTLTLKQIHNPRTLFEVVRADQNVLTAMVSN